MIFFKHVWYLALMYGAVLIGARLLINRINRRAGMAAVPIDLAFLVQVIGLSLVFPMAAQGGFDFLRSMGVVDNIARLVSLGVVGGLYGWFFGLQEYVHQYPSIALGIAGGLCTAALYLIIPTDPFFFAQALFASVMLVLPLLSIDFPEGPIARTLRAGLSILPLNGYLR